ncbi:MAG: M24 family metallopeptidase [Acidimicrobiales bacterium]
MPNRLSRIGRREQIARATARALRESHDARPLLLTSSAAVGWRTGGLSDPIDLTASTDPVWVVDTDHGCALITSEIEGPRLAYDYRVTDLGWQLVLVPWYQSDAALAAACTFAARPPEDFLSDAPGVGTSVRADLVAARLTLSEPEREDLRELGALVGRAVGRGVAAWRPGVSTDLEVAALTSGVLEEEGARAVCLIVGGDDRLRRFRHPLAVGDVCHDAIMVVVVARRRGLHAAATRIAVRRADDEIVALARELATVDDAVLAASLPGGTWGEAVEALARGYAAIGRANEWRDHFQGGPIGFEQREFELAPGQSTSPYWTLTRETHTAVAWNPSVRGGAKIEDTYLVGAGGLEPLTVTPSWPTTEGVSGVTRSAVRVV